MNESPESYGHRFIHKDESTSLVQRLSTKTKEPPPPPPGEEHKEEAPLEEDHVEDTEEDEGASSSTDEVPDDVCLFWKLHRAYAVTK